MVGTIVVIGRRIYDPQVLLGSIDEGSGSSDHPQLSPEPGGGWWQDESAYIDCLKDGVAYDVAQRIRDLEIRLEQAAVIFKDSDGNVVAGAISAGTIFDVSAQVSGSVGFANILGQIHNHPATGDTLRDAETAEADQYPSSNDWAALGALAISVAAAGGDIGQLSMYIIDQSGYVREFRLADRSIYDVPEAQLLREPRQPPLPPPPPLPEPMRTRPTC